MKTWELPSKRVSLIFTLAIIMPLGHNGLIPALPISFNLMLTRYLPNSTSPIVKTCTALLASAGVLVGVVYFVGFDETARAVKEAGPWSFLALGLLTFLPLLLQAVAWVILNRAIHHGIPFGTLLSAVIVGMGVNIVTPSS